MLPAIWDYIVVGGGLAGTTLSSRLLEYNSSLQILLIEAGGDASSDASILYENSTNLVHGTYDWAYLTTAQENLNNRHIDAPAGRCLGGGTAINGCEWMRGDETDYQDWADMVDDDRWGYDNMLQYIKKSEQWFSTQDEAAHGQDGAIFVSSPEYENRTYPLGPDLMESWQQLGVPVRRNEDTNAGNNIGLGQLNQNRIRGARQVANTRYPLDGVTVLTHTLVQSVMVDTDDNTPTATGVVLANGTEYQAREVIIPVKLDQPQVGRNFLDHFQFDQNWKLVDPSQDYAIGSGNKLFTGPQYSWGAHIPFTVSNPIPASGIAAAIEADEGTAPDPSTNFYLRNVQAMNENNVGFAAHTTLGDGVHIDGTHIASTIVGLKPSSRGSITISSARIENGPIIDPNYYATELDKYSWRTGLRNITQLMLGNTTLGRSIIASETPPEGFEPMTLDSTDDYLESRIAHGAFSTYHPMGSCSMGKVVDTDLRVIGVDNLRVVDASIIPIPFGAHLQSPTYALAEHAAAIIAGSANDLQSGVSSIVDNVDNTLKKILS
ncbi:hypothetical protein NPX13_g5756 [Xylaria arbuscula]|uniref:Glucose-methanol-choline oxidoreductase N-terminal domain-containing protein n=1 Tax=Xylaria arbuscula TaxID=114810 RepID=A0A9W8NDZ1_9PEZI|nr:hypothetical protein NPX13_g5756 [Xylaria arbuscula]